MSKRPPRHGCHYEQPSSEWIKSMVNHSYRYPLLVVLHPRCTRNWRSDTNQEVCLLWSLSGRSTSVELFPIAADVSFIIRVVDVCPIIPAKIVVWILPIRPTILPSLIRALSVIALVVSFGHLTILQSCCGILGGVADPCVSEMRSTDVRTCQQEYHYFCFSLFAVLVYNDSTALRTG